MIDSHILLEKIRATIQQEDKSLPESQKFIHILSRESPYIYTNEARFPVTERYIPWKVNRPLVPPDRPNHSFILGCIRSVRSNVDYITQGSHLLSWWWTSFCRTQSVRFRFFLTACSSRQLFQIAINVECGWFNISSDRFVHHSINAGDSTGFIRSDWTSDKRDGHWFHHSSLRIQMESSRWNTTNRWEKGSINERDETSLWIEDVVSSRWWWIVPLG